jgi:hypothetical protein
MMQRNASNSALPGFRGHTRIWTPVLASGADQEKKSLFFEKISKELLRPGFRGQIRYWPGLQKSKSFLVLFFKK